MKEDSTPDISDVVVELRRKEGTTPQGVHTTNDGSWQMSTEGREDEVSRSKDVQRILMFGIFIGVMMTLLLLNMMPGQAGLSPARLLWDNSPLGSMQRYWDAWTLLEQSWITSIAFPDLLGALQSYRLEAGMAAFSAIAWAGTTGQLPGGMQTLNLLARGRTRRRQPSLPSPPAMPKQSLDLAPAAQQALPAMTGMPSMQKLPSETMHGQMPGHSGLVISNPQPVHWNAGARNVPMLPPLPITPFEAMMPWVMASGQHQRPQFQMRVQPDGSIAFENPCQAANVWQKPPLQGPEIYLSNPGQLVRANN